MSQDRAKMAPKSLPGASRRRKKEGPQHDNLILPSRRAPKSLPEASGAGKNSLLSSGGAPGEIPNQISPAQGGPGSVLGSILASPGDPFGLFLGPRDENLEISKTHFVFQLFSMIFEGSGTSRGSFLEPKTLPKATQTPRLTLRAQTWLPKRFWSAP